MMRTTPAARRPSTARPSQRPSRPAGPAQFHDPFAGPAPIPAYPAVGRAADAVFRSFADSTETVPAFRADCVPAPAVFRTPSGAPACGGGVDDPALRRELTGGRRAPHRPVRIADADLPPDPARTAAINAAKTAKAQKPSRRTRRR